MRRYLIQSPELFNIKSHELATQWLSKEFTTICCTSTAAAQFIRDHNQDDVTILLYNQGGPTYRYYLPVVQCLHALGQNLQSSVIVFSFDWWLHPNSSECNQSLRLMFNALNYTVVSFASLSELSEYHGIDYAPVRHNLIHCNLWSCYRSSFCPHNKNPVSKLAVTGSISNKHYPERALVAKCKSVTVVPANRHGHRNNTTYNQILNSHVACFVSSVYVYNATADRYTNTHCVLLKTFETLASGSLLVVPSTECPYLSHYGLTRNKHYMALNFDDNLQDQINQILGESSVDLIRLTGQEYARSSLTTEHKLKELVHMLQLEPFITHQESRTST